MDSISCLIIGPFLEKQYVSLFSPPGPLGGLQKSNLIAKRKSQEVMQVLIHGYTGLLAPEQSEVFSHLCGHALLHRIPSEHNPWCKISQSSTFLTKTKSSSKIAVYSKNF
jgi:hypothetical protein